MNRRNGEEMAEQLSNFVNGMTSTNKKEFAQKVVSDHRTLQEDTFMLFMECVKGWAKSYEEGNYDARNEFTCKTSAEIKKLIFD